MIALGFHSLYPLDRLSVMGLVEPLKRLPELLRIRRQLYRHFLDHQFDLVLGIDSPDFTIGLELKLRRQGMLTAHYVSPSVWAWRQGRIRKIARAVDRMLTLFPFETTFYRRHHVPVTFVGHPLADSLPVVPDQPAAVRERLGLAEGPLLAILPGSRGAEVATMGPLFLEVARRLRQTLPELSFVIPSASVERHQQLESLLDGCSDLPVTLVAGKAHDVMAASDAVLLTSGTTALEAMLLKKPMVVAYRMAPASYWLLSKLVKSPYIALPNLLAGEALVPELIQDQATVDNLSRHTLEQLVDGEQRRRLVQRFTALHQSLRRDAAETAADVLTGMIEARRKERPGDD